MQKFGTGQIVDENGQPVVRKTASAPLSEEDVRQIEDEDE
jgi:hypothetical protein